MKTGEADWVYIREGDLHGLVDSEAKGLLEPGSGFFDDLDARVKVCGGRVLKDSRIRWAAIVPVGQGMAVFIKRFRSIGGWQKCKYLFLPSRAVTEWRISRFLRHKGILTPRAVAALERRKHGILEESFFVTQALEGASDLLHFCKERLRNQNDKKRDVIGVLAETIRKIHDAGLFHRDLHAGNLLLTGGRPLSLYLVDLHQARRRRRVSLAERLWNMAQLFNSLDFIMDREAREAFFLAYSGGCGLRGGSMEVHLRRVEGMIRKMAARHEKSRAKRCLKESTLFALERGRGWRVFRRREIGADEIEAILSVHRETVRLRPEDLLKHSAKTIVSLADRVGARGLRVCVKQYRYERPWDRWRNSIRRPKGKASWVAGNTLFRLGFSPLKPLAYAERRRLGLLQEAFFITESCVGDTELDRYLVQRFEEKPRSHLRRFIEEFAGWLGSLHGAGIYHRDLKTCNILVRERPDGWSFSLLDLEDVTQGTAVGSEEVLRNLVQINCSIPGFLSYTDRVRFFKAYLRSNPISVDERGVIRRVLEESRRQGVVYVSPGGLVVEGFE
ncbi:MAG: hypothetical protein JRJ26_02380 [Deltaproteobacteria bacterium]|nr:hypothetical protein [Deltaproteobacteria bacterium]